MAAVVYLQKSHLIIFIKIILSLLVSVGRVVAYGLSTVDCCIKWHFFFLKMSEKAAFVKNSHGKPLIFK